MGVLNWKIEVCITSEYFFSSKNKFKNLKIFSLSIFNNAENQNLNKFIFKGKKWGENAWWIIMYTNWVGDLHHNYVYKYLVPMLLY